MFLDKIFKENNEEEAIQHSSSSGRILSTQEKINFAYEKNIKEFDVLFESIWDKAKTLESLQRNKSKNLTWIHVSATIFIRNRLKELLKFLEEEINNCK